MILKGTVRNVIDFGAFVDIGVHQDGLVHISQMTERYIKHPLEAVSVGDIVEVKVMSVDLKKTPQASYSLKLFWKSRTVFHSGYLPAQIRACPAVSRPHHNLLAWGSISMI